MKEFFDTPSQPSPEQETQQAKEIYDRQVLQVIRSKANTIEQAAKYLAATLSQKHVSPHIELYHPTTRKPGFWEKLQDPMRSTVVPGEPAYIGRGWQISTATTDHYQEMSRSNSSGSSYATSRSIVLLENGKLYLCDNSSAAGEVMERGELDFSSRVIHPEFTDYVGYYDMTVPGRHGESLAQATLEDGHVYTNLVRIEDDLRRSGRQLLSLDQ